MKGGQPITGIDNFLTTLPGRIGKALRENVRICTVI
jgi:hypothetical protein